jgi:hypothetical protein
MIVPCNTNVTVTVSLSGHELLIAPGTYVFTGPLPHSVPLGGNACLAGFSGSSAIRPGEHTTFLDISTGTESHVE